MRVKLLVIILGLMVLLSACNSNEKDELNAKSESGVTASEESNDYDEPIDTEDVSAGLF